MSKQNQLRHKNQWDQENLQIQFNKIKLQSQK
jgi:hypothetical protein